MIIRTYVPDKLDLDSIMRRALTVSNANGNLSFLSAQPKRKESNKCRGRDETKQKTT
jgi:hypothetical protein